MKKILTSIILTIILVTVWLTTVAVSAAHAQTSVRLGIIGDSSSDEYRADDNRAGGTQWAATTLSWNELLNKYRQVDLGSWGTRAEPRRSGFEYNWARSGAKAAGMISSGMHTGIAQQVSQGKIDIVFLDIGSNDFAWWNNEYQNLYNGVTNPDQKAAAIIGHIRTAVETVQAAGPVPMIVSTIPNLNYTPQVVTDFPDATKRERVTSAVNLVNQQIKALVAEKNLTLLDSDLIAQRLIGQLVNGQLIIAGESISLLVNGNEPHHIVLGDNIHGGTVSEGFFANFVIEKMNTALGIDIKPFSDIELLQNAGIQVSGVPTSTPIPTATATPLATPTDIPEATATPVDGVTPTVTPNSCPEDINDDLFIDISDYSILVNSFLADPPLDSRADIDGDGIADLSDYSRLVNKFLQSCE